jgi:hypothetical protein
MTPTDDQLAGIIELIAPTALTTLTHTALTRVNAQREKIIGRECPRLSDGHGEGSGRGVCSWRGQREMTRP